MILASALPALINDCDVSPAISTRIAQIAQVLRGLEHSSAQLHWLFQFFFPASIPNQLAYAERELEQAQAQFSINAVSLNRMLHGPSADYTLKAFELGRLSTNIALAYRQLASGLARAIDSCKQHTTNLTTELATIQKVTTDKSPGST